jgi:hypothetical protein
MGKKKLNKIMDKEPKYYRVGNLGFSYFRERLECLLQDFLRVFLIFKEDNEI